MSKPHVIVRSFLPDDVYSLQETIDIGANLVDWSSGAGVFGPAFTGLVDGRVAGCGGITIKWQGCGEAWSVFAKWAVRYKRHMLVYCRRFIDDQQSALRLWRLEATLRTDLPESWLKHLGFEKEGLMRRYCPDGCDSWMWARIREVY